MPCCLLCMSMLQSCRACDPCLLLLPMHEAERISLKDNSPFLINNSGDRQKTTGKCQWGCSVFPSLPRRILKCFAAVRSKGGCTSVSIAALRSSLPLAAVVGFRQRGTLSNQRCDCQGERRRGREQVHR